MEEALSAGKQGKIQKRESDCTTSAAVAVPRLAWGSSQETKTNEAHKMLTSRIIIRNMVDKVHEPLQKKQELVSLNAVFCSISVHRPFNFKLSSVSNLKK